MAEIESVTVTLPADMAATVRAAIDGGDYVSASEIVREALRDWKLKRAVQVQELAAFKADIERGLADVEAGRVRDFDVGRIVERGGDCYPAARLQLTEAAEADPVEIWSHLALDRLQADEDGPGADTPVLDGAAIFLVHTVISPD